MDNPLKYSYRPHTVAESNILKCLGAYLGIFLFFFLFYALAGYRESVPGYMIFLQFFFFFFYTTALYGCYKIRFTRFEFYFCVFLYSLIAGFVVREISWNFRGEPFLGGIDSVTYDVWGRNAVTNNTSYSQYLQNIKDAGFSTDDLGMPSIVYPVYMIFGNSRLSQDFLIILNSLAIMGAAWRLDGILRYYDIGYKIRKFCVGAYAFLPFLSLTAGVGLKENFFVFIIISAFYYMGRYKETRKRTYLAYSFILSFLCLFFRTAVFAMILICLYISNISKEKNKKGVLKFIFYSGVLGIFFLSILLTVLFGRGLDLLLAVTAARTGQVSDSVGGVGQWIIGSLAVFAGPFPNFSKLSEYALVHSSGVLLKGILGFPLILGLISIIRKKLWKYYSLMVYFIFNFILVVLVGVSLDMRYQVPFYPLAIPMAAPILEKKPFKILFGIYIFFLFILIWFYNKR